MAKCSDIDLLLVGKSGQGKTCTGNNLIGRDAFNCRYRRDTVTAAVDFDYVNKQGRILKIVNGLSEEDLWANNQSEDISYMPTYNAGMGASSSESTTLSQLKDINLSKRSLLLHELSSAAAASPNGYNAILLVLKFGQEQETTCNFLEVVFGEVTVMEFCIIVMTGGDLFEQMSNGVSFSDWCNKQTGTFKDLLSKCNNRIILFDNKTKKKFIRERQIHELLSKIDQLGGKRYTNKYFRVTHTIQKRVLQQSIGQDTKDETIINTSLKLNTLINELNTLTEENIDYTMNEPKECLSFKTHCSVTEDSIMTGNSHNAFELNNKTGEEETLNKTSLRINSLREEIVNLQQQYKGMKNQYKEKIWYQGIKEISMANINKDSDLDILLIGKIGNGKSSTGNTILGRQIFTRSGNMTSETTAMDFDYAEVEGRIVKVVDVQGVNDEHYEYTKKQSIDSFIHAMEHAVVANPKGYHAFLIVLKYGSRFTKEENDTIQFLKAVFGHTFIKEYCIIVLTCGDYFIHDVSDTFERWCGQQSGQFKELVSECCNRIVLIDNNCNSKDEKQKQIRDLFYQIDKLKGKRYTARNFQMAKQTHMEIIEKSEMSAIKEKILRNTAIIRQKLEEYQESVLIEIENLEILLIWTESIEIYLKDVEKRTKLLNEMGAAVTTLKSIISKEIKLNVGMRKEKADLEMYCKKLEDEANLEKTQIKKEYSELLQPYLENDPMRKIFSDELNLKLVQVADNLRIAKQKKEQEIKNKMNIEREKLKKEKKKMDEEFQDIKRGFIFTLLSTLQNIYFTFRTLLGKFMGQ